MEAIDTIIESMEQMYVSRYQEMMKLEGLFSEASAGGIVWKIRKKKQSKKNEKIAKNEEEGRRYAYYQFYDKRKPKGKRKTQKYIKKEDKEYFFNLIEERRKQWERLLQVRKLVHKLIRGLKAFGVFADELISKKMVARHVKARKAASKKIYPEGCQYLTAKGEYVRSRAERKIANELFYLGIPYAHEKKIIINGKSFLPDFTIYYKGKVFYLEHLGMLDVEEYATRWEEKKREYEKAGIREGVNLIVTTEKNFTYLQLLKELKKLNII